MFEIIWDNRFRLPWGWGIDSSTYNPRTHEITPKKEYIEELIEREHKIRESLEDGERNYIKRVSELKAESKAREDELKSKLKD